MKKIFIHSLAHIGNIHIVMPLSLEYNFAYFCGSLGAEFLHIFFLRLGLVGFFFILYKSFLIFLLSPRKYTGKCVSTQVLTN